MNKPTYTPEPWAADEDGWYIRDASGRTVCQLVDRYGFRFFDDETTLANATLIVKVHEMADILRRMATHKGDDLGLFAHEAAQLIKEIDNN